jgi:nicotinate phosphoribosyltransferase
MLSALATDLYQVTMMAGYHASGQNQLRTFELFVRGLPDHRQYLVAAGLEQAIEYLVNLRFTPEEIAWLRTLPALSDVAPSFFDTYLPAFGFTGDVWAVEEGEVIFSHEPLLRVTAPAAEAQLVETALLALITFQTSVASKASRVVTAARMDSTPASTRPAPPMSPDACRRRTSRPAAALASPSAGQWRTHG